MRYLYKKGDRVVSRKLKRAGTICATTNYPQEGYRVNFDEDPNEPHWTGNGGPKIAFSIEDDLYPESPTYEQAERELCRVMMQMVEQAKAHLALLEEATGWAKKMVELKRAKEGTNDTPP